MKNNFEEDLWVLMDLRGLILHMYHSGTDHDAVKDDDGNVLKTPGHTTTQFAERYLLPALELVPANKIIAIQDAGNEYRKAILPTYKSNRVPGPETVRQATNASQDAVKQLLHSVGVPQVSVAGTEADDVIAYFEQNLPGSKLIYTVDGDLVAMSKSTTSVFLKGDLANVFTYKAKPEDITVKPEHITLFKSLVGDSSDGYKGVHGFGPKAWVSLLEEYGEDGIFELDRIMKTQSFSALKDILAAEPGQHKLLQKIQDKLPEWRTAYEVALLHPELVDQRYGKEFRRLRWEKRVPSRERLERLSKEIGALYLLQDFEAYLPKQILITKNEWDDGVIAEAKQLFEDSRYVSLDYETWSPENKNFEEAATGTYVDMFDSRIAGMGITCGRNLEYTFYFTFDHADEENSLDKRHIIDLLNQRPEGMPIIIQNNYFEICVSLENLGLKLEKCYDTKIMASHVAEHDTTGLKDLSKRWMNYNQIRYSDVVAKGKTMKDYTSAEVFQYGADDPLITAHLFDLFYVIMQVEGTWEFCRDNEFDFVEVLSDAYTAGTSVDWDEVDRQHAEDAATLSTEIQSIRGVLSSKQEEGMMVDGARMWEEELLINFDADTAFYTKEFNKIIANNPAIEIEKALQGNKKLYELINDGPACKFTNETTEEEIQLFASNMRDFLKESRETKRLGIAKKAMADSAYVEYKEEVSEAKFSFRASSIRIIANGYGMPDTPSKLEEDKFSKYIDGLEKPFSPAVDAFLDNVMALLGTAKSKRSKCEEYKQLAKEFSLFADKKIKKEGTELNLGSPIQQQKLFYGTLGLPIRLRALDVSEGRQKKGLQGSPQTNEDAVRTAIAAGDAPEGSWKRSVLESLMTAKKCRTRISLFYSKFPLWRHPKDDLMHPQFNSVGTETRRPTGSSPNLLQLSKKGDGVKIRKCFIPNQKLGHDLIVTIDWDGEELRLMGGLSSDKELLSCYTGNNKRNVHSLTASGILGISYDDFTKVHLDKDNPQSKSFDDTRKSAKGVNFLSAYGGGAGKLARVLLCSEDTAKGYLKAKKELYSGFEDWRRDQIQQLHNKGYVSTLYGSRKHVFNLLNNPDEGLVAYYERASINFMVQGLAADYLKKVMADMNKAKTLKRHGAILIAPVYDELVMSCHHSQVVGLVKEAYGFMTQGIPGIEIPMLANPALGVNFADQTEILIDADDTLTDEKIIAAMEKVLGPTTLALAA